MDQESLQASARRWMHASLEAFGGDEALDFAVHHAGVGLEHLLKAYLYSLHPALIVDATHWPSMLHAVGHGEGSALQETRIKSIGLKLAFERVSGVLKPKIGVSNATFEPVSAARNGVAHVGAYDVETARLVISTCIRVAAPVLAELTVDPKRYWGNYAGLVEQLASERVNEIRLGYESKLAHAKSVFAQRFGGLPTTLREGVVAAVAATEVAFSDYGIQTDCPACESRAWLDGVNEIAEVFEEDYPASGQVPNLVFSPSYFRCVVCGLELDGDEIKVTSLEYDPYRHVDDPSSYITPDEDFAYESWRDDQIIDS